MKLNQVLATEAEIKGRAHSTITKVHRASEKPELFNGFHKKWLPKSEEDTDGYPDETNIVQMSVEDNIREIKDALSELFNVEAQKDWANCNARANVVVDGKILLTNVPSTYLLFLEKQLRDLRTFVDRLPVLSTSDEWTWDQAVSLWRAKPTKQHKTRKVQKPIVLYDATEHHPAQTQIINEDQIIGYWEQTKHSGAMTSQHKRSIASRIDKLSLAVKRAREQANMTDAEEQSVGHEVLEFIFNEPS